MIKYYKVGGAVRDQLLGRTPREVDYVVIGSTPEYMLSKGFKPVGKHFPVFLHPETKEEYALARTEKKVGKGYKGFVFYTSPDITLEQDLRRRDITINAMAQDPQTGQIIDPYNGQADLAAGCLRHVSSAFSEDPLRVLRVARFASRLPTFDIHPDTLALMQSLTASGELDALSPERIWQELCYALNSQAPWRFIETMHACHADLSLFSCLYTSLSPTITAWPCQTLSALQRCVTHCTDPTVRFAVLLSAFPTHAIAAFCQHFRIPNAYKHLAIQVARWRPHFQKLTPPSVSADAILTLFDGLDVWRRPQVLTPFLTACYASSDTPHTAKEICADLEIAYTIAKTVNVQSCCIPSPTLSGKAIGDAIRAARLHAIATRQHPNKNDNTD